MRYSGAIKQRQIAAEKARRDYFTKNTKAQKVVDLKQRQSSSRWSRKQQYSQKVSEQKIDVGKQVLNYYRRIELERENIFARLDLYRSNMKISQIRELNTRILLIEKELKVLEQSYPVCKYYRMQKELKEQRRKAAQEQEKQEGKHLKEDGEKLYNPKNTVLDFEQAKRKKEQQKVAQTVKVEKEERKEVSFVLIDTVHNKVIISYAQDEQLEIGNLKSFYSPTNVLNTKYQFIRQILNINLRTDEQIKQEFGQVFHKLDPAVLCAISKSKNAEENLRRYCIALRNKEKLPFKITHDLTGLAKNPYLDENTKNILYYTADENHKVSNVQEGLFAYITRKLKKVFKTSNNLALPEKTEEEIAEEQRQKQEREKLEDIRQSLREQYGKIDINHKFNAYKKTMEMMDEDKQVGKDIDIYI